MRLRGVLHCLISVFIVNSKVTCGHPDHGEIEDNDMKVMCMLDKAFIRKFSSREVLLLSQVRVTF